MVDLLVDISSRLFTNEQVVDQLRADKIAEEERSQSLSLRRTTPCTSRGRTRRRQMTGPWHPDDGAVINISDTVWVKVAN